MSFVSEVVGALEGLDLVEVESRGPEVVADLVSRGRAEKDKVVDLVSEALPGSETITGAAVDDVLDRVEANAGLFVGLTASAVTRIAGYFHEDEKEKARNVLVAKEATLEEAAAWISSGGDAVQEEREARDKQWEETMTFLSALGKIGLKILVAIGKLLIFPV